MNTSKKSFTTLLAVGLLGLALSSASAFASDLDVTFSHIEKQEGELLVALFDSETAYGGKAKPVRVAKIAADAEQISVSFTGLENGMYALKLLHDLNGNGAMDTNMLGMPTEGYGFSNNVGKFGMPAFNEAAFSIEQNTQIEVFVR
jgi:uncharacterized protein (DUF2141 family)